jgi:hypothetical protein
LIGRWFNVAPPRRDPKQHIHEIRDLEPHLKNATPKVRELTVGDLDDLATKFKGHDPGNPKVAALNLQDLQSLEASFQGLRQEAARRAQHEGVPGEPTPADPEDWSISCCSCTPCCCCAAAEVDPFAA